MTETMVDRGMAPSLGPHVPHTIPAMNHLKPQYRRQLLKRVGTRHSSGVRLERFDEAPNS